MTQSPPEPGAAAQQRSIRLRPGVVPLAQLAEQTTAAHVAVHDATTATGAAVHASKQERRRAAEQARSERLSAEEAARVTAAHPAEH